MPAAVRTYVTFQSDLFNSTEQQDYFVNPDCFGDDFCKFMIAALQDLGIRCDDAPCGEDWGWLFWLQFDGRDFDFCTNYHRDGFWLAFVQPPKGMFGGLLGRGKKDVPIDLTCTLHGILSETEGIHDIRWHDERDFDRGYYDRGTADPG